MHPHEPRPHHGHRPRRTFLGEVAYRIKHRVAVKIALALLKLAVVAFLGLLLAVALLVFYVAHLL